jgi:hypothetical protein
MPMSTKPAAAPDRRAARPIGTEDRPSIARIVLAAWLVPGAAHALQGETRKALIFFVTLVAMFTIGIGLGGRLFPFLLAEPLVFLQALAEWVLGLPCMVAALGGYGRVKSWQRPTSTATPSSWLPDF